MKFERIRIFTICSTNFNKYILQVQFVKVSLFFATKNILIGETNREFSNVGIQELLDLVNKMILYPIFWIPKNSISST